MIGECHDILRIISLSQLKMFDKLRKDSDFWETFQSFVRDQKLIKLDKIYRLRRPKSNDDIIKNAIELEYYAARISGLVVLLQLMENAEDELERRDRKKRD